MLKRTLAVAAVSMIAMGAVAGSAQAAVKTIPKAQVAKHATPSSCWSIVNGSVYDLTRYIPMHPSGPADVIAICGKNGSALFNAQHSMSRRAQAELAALKIGKAGK